PNYPIGADFAPYRSNPRPIVCGPLLDKLSGYVILSESMTFGIIAMVERKLIRVQEKGQITLPAEVRRKLGVKKGDFVSVVETAEGVLITPQEVLAASSLARMGDILKEKGLS